MLEFRHLMHKGDPVLHQFVDRWVARMGKDPMVGVYGFLCLFWLGLFLIIASAAFMVKKGDAEIAIFLQTKSGIAFLIGLTLMLTGGVMRFIWFLPFRETLNLIERHATPRSTAWNMLKQDKSPAEKETGRWLGCEATVFRGRGSRRLPEVDKLEKNWRKLHARLQALLPTLPSAEEYLGLKHSDPLQSEEEGSDSNGAPIVVV